jgi:hypothetical protein
VSTLFLNPELLRYTRSQLRLARVLAYAGITLLLSFTIAFFYVHQGGIVGRGAHATGDGLLHFAFIVQGLIFAGGGGIACLNSIYTEKDRNTFDFQRVTRLSSLELALGKLFGAPLLTYLICVCLAPLTIYAAVLAGAEPLHVLAAYVVLFVASLAFQAFNLLLSLVLVRGAHVTGIILSLFVLYLFSVAPSYQYFYLHPLGPFSAPELALSDSWKVYPPNGHVSWHYSEGQFTDVFWGYPVHHFPVLVLVDLLLTLWFLLAVARNIKRDAKQYELYSPLQFFGLAAFLNVLLASFYNTRWATTIETQSFFLTLNIVLLGLLGVGLLRSRERMRTLLRSEERRSSYLAAAVWPAPVLGLAAIFAGGLISACLYYSHSPNVLNLQVVLLRSLFFAIWIVCNIQFLQLMNLRGGKHPLVVACLCLLIYYICASFFLSALRLFETPQRHPFTSLFLPSPIFAMDSASWAQTPSVWMEGFIVQLVLLALFLYLQVERLRKLRISSTQISSAPASSA